jgi:hypothetical protein
MHKMVKMQEWVRGLFMQKMGWHTCSLTISNQYLTMLNVISLLQVASQFLSLGNVFQGLVHWVLALRDIQAISSNLIPTRSSPDAPTVFSDFQDERFSRFCSYSERALP